MSSQQWTDTSRPGLAQHGDFLAEPHLAHLKCINSAWC